MIRTWVYLFLQKLVEPLWSESDSSQKCPCLHGSILCPSLHFRYYDRITQAIEQFNLTWHSPNFCTVLTHRLELGNSCDWLFIFWKGFSPFRVFRLGLIICFWSQNWDMNQQTNKQKLSVIASIRSFYDYERFPLSFTLFEVYDRDKNKQETRIFSFH